MEEEKINQIGKFPKENFLKRYRVAFIAAGGLLVLHIGWWRVVETFVPIEERPKYFAYLANLAKLDPFRSKEEEKKK